MDKKQYALIRSACLQNGVSFEVGKAIIDNYFRMMKEIIKDAGNDEYKNMRVMKLGIFYSTEQKRKQTEKSYEQSQKNKIRHRRNREEKDES